MKSFGIVVLTGVSGSGKTTIGHALASLASVVFADADDYHSAANKSKMAAGYALDDTDREPWLQALNRLLQSWFAGGTSGVLACSALKQSYRAALEVQIPAGAVRFVLLEGSRELIARRLADRKHDLSNPGSFMNPNLLDSQLLTLEPLQDGLRIVNDRTPAEAAAEILEMLRA